MYNNVTDSCGAAAAVAAMPLSFNWTLWYVESCAKGEDWKTNIRNVFGVSTAGQFIEAYSTAKLPSALLPGASYCFFKNGIPPVWEEEPNKGAGAWKMLVANRTKCDLNLIWSDLLFALISDGLGELSMYLCGVTCTVRKGDTHKVTVWTVKTTPRNYGHIMMIGQILRAIVVQNIYVIKSIKYELHESSSNGFDYTL